MGLYVDIMLSFQRVKVLVHCVVHVLNSAQCRGKPLFIVSVRETESAFEADLFVAASCSLK